MLNRDYLWLTGPTGCMICHRPIDRIAAIKMLQEHMNLECFVCRQIVTLGEEADSNTVNFENDR